MDPVLEAWLDDVPSAWSGFLFFSVDTKGNLAWWGPNIFHPDWKTLLS